MSTQNNTGDPDLDRQIGEMDKAIRLNPRNSAAYRERGYLHARKRNLDYALRDINQALALDQKDPRAYFARGLIMNALKQGKGAVADLDRAIELDPEHADMYRSHRDKIARAIVAQQTEAHTSNLPNGLGSDSKTGLGGFFRRLAQYYAEFLSTDFKKQRLPRRRIQTSDEKGRLVGIALRKYPGFQQKLWQELNKPISAGLSLNVPRGVWRSALPKAVIDATATHIDGVTQEQLNAVINGILATTLKMPNRKGADPVVAFEQFIENIRSECARMIIAPLLDRMEAFFERTENKPVESLKELEDQLSTRLSHGVESASGGAFSIFLVEGDAAPGPRPFDPAARLRVAL